MDRCPRIVGGDNPRACKGHLSFFGVSQSPWLRWTQCDICGSYTATHEKGGLVANQTNTPILLEARKADAERDYSDYERPDDVQQVPQVQRKRVGGPIGRHQLQGVHETRVASES